MEQAHPQPSKCQGSSLKMGEYKKGAGWGVFMENIVVTGTATLDSIKMF